jgi:hypothetical protein
MTAAEDTGDQPRGLHRLDFTNQKAGYGAVGEFGLLGYVLWFETPVRHIQEDSLGVELRAGALPYCHDSPIINGLSQLSSDFCATVVFFLREIG